LLLALHGAGGSGAAHLKLLRATADELGLIVLAPDSRSATWDLIAQEAFGPDLAFIAQALRHVAERWEVDPDRVAISGFSDGASYALSLGLANGELFGDLVGFSPGFLTVVERVGRPRVFVSHGTRDPILPVDRCSRSIVPALRHAGHEVIYREFEGGHAIPKPLLAEGLTAFVRKR
jgi:phospholipase/carboxylesterase